MDNTPLESVLEDELVRRVKAHGGECLKLVILNQAHWPDRTIFLPGGIIAIIECKREKNSRTSRGQERWLKRLKDLGFDARRISTMDELDEFIF